MANRRDFLKGMLALPVATAVAHAIVPVEKKIEPVQQPVLPRRKSNNISYAEFFLRCAVVDATKHGTGIDEGQLSKIANKFNHLNGLCKSMDTAVKRKTSGVVEGSFTDI